MLHWRSSAPGPWINKEGDNTYTSAGGFTNGSPYARPGGCVWWPATAGGKPRPKAADGNVKRPTFPLEGGAWENSPGAGFVPVCDKAAARDAAKTAGYPDSHDWSKRGYPDVFGIGVGTPVTVWKSIATDRSVIPKGTRIYIEALKDTPAKGCFTADDTGGAIIGKHIDVLVPYGTKGMPSAGELLALPEGVPCPPGRALKPGPLGELSVSYLVPAAEGSAFGERGRAKGVTGRYAEDFLYGTNGAVARAAGVTRGGKTIVPLGGGWWVNAQGRKTVLRADGTWSRGIPVWRDGGWRTAKGQPTYRRADGTWAMGKGVRYRQYRDRFRLAAADEYRPWRTAWSTRATAPVGTLLAATPVLDQASCLVVTRAVKGIPANSIRIVVPPETDVTALPQTAPVTVLEAADTRTGCPRRR
jgi:3D (Asp-Asp-Asp) domain-containing protein